MIGKTNCNAVSIRTVVKPPFACYYDVGGAGTVFDTDITGLIPGKKYIVGIFASYGNMGFNQWSVTGGTVTRIINQGVMGRADMIVPDGDTIHIKIQWAGGGSSDRLRVFEVDSDFEGIDHGVWYDGDARTATISLGTPKKVYALGAMNGAFRCRPVPDSDYEYNNYTLKSSVGVANAVGVVQFVFPNELTTVQFKMGAVSGTTNYYRFFT